MNWINKVTPPGLKTMLTNKKDTPDDLWVKCPVSGELVYKTDLEENWHVTPAGAHLRISPRTRFRLLFDDERWEPIELPEVPMDPLKFKDDKPYPARLKAAKAKIAAREKKETEGGGAPLLQDDCMVAAYGKIGGVPAVVLVQDFAFMGSSLGMAAGEGLYHCGAHGARPQSGLCRLHRFRRRADAGRHAEPDADAAHDAGHQ
ncbi:MAG: hypothetical protein R3C13_06680 [Hyphomonas sp.]